MQKTIEQLTDIIIEENEPNLDDEEFLESPRKEIIDVKAYDYFVFKNNNDDSH